VLRPAGDALHRWRGRGGAAGTKPAPGPVTTDDKPPSNHEHHEVPLQC
jgi:hypothetical protein